MVIPTESLRYLVAQGLTDSKRLSSSSRQVLAVQIRTMATVWAVAEANVQEIDAVNILQATFLAMTRAVKKLGDIPQQALVDGNRPIPNLSLPQQTIVQGDSKEPLIAAASVLAKVYRDQLMVELDSRYPGYGLAAHKGYGTKRHLEAMERLGLTDQHRLSFAPCRAILRAIDR
ncbi:MAG: ribonuclease HII [Gloeobacterales cyanobacterium]